MFYRIVIRGRKSGFCLGGKAEENERKNKMKNDKTARLKDGDEVQTEWSAVAYDLWRASMAQEYIPHDEMRVVNLYDVVNSVIEADFTPAEQAAARLHWFEGFSVNCTAKKLGTSTSNIYKALNRGKEKLRLVLKHIFYSEVYKTELETP